MKTDCSPPEEAGACWASFSPALARLVQVHTACSALAALRAELFVASAGWDLRADWVESVRKDDGETEHCLIEREAYRIVPEDCRLRCCVELVAIAWVLMRGLLHNHHERKARQHGGLGALCSGTDCCCGLWRGHGWSLADWRRRC